MTDKVGRNDPCPCGSGKKYKQCCLSKKKGGLKGKITAKWLNAKEPEEKESLYSTLMDRTFGNMVEETRQEEPFKEETPQEEVTAPPESPSPE